MSSSAAARRSIILVKLNKVFVGETSCKKFPPRPFQELSHNNYLNRVVSARTDSRRERKARFCYRERLGTTETPSAKRVVLQIEMPRAERGVLVICLLIHG